MVWAGNGLRCLDNEIASVKVRYKHSSRKNGKHIAAWLLVSAKYWEPDTDRLNSKYLFTFVAEAGNCNAGIGYNGLDEHGQPKWDLMSNAKVRNVEVRFLSQKFINLISSIDL